MKYVYLALGWTFGVLFALAGVVSLFESPLGGLCLLAIAALFLPPVRTFAFAKTGQTMSPKFRGVFAFVLFAIFGTIIGDHQKQKELEAEAQQAKALEERVAQKKREALDYFNANRVEILSTVKASITSGDHKTAISESLKYREAKDVELEGLFTQAKSQALLSELKTIPKSDNEKQLGIYQQLVSLDPANASYKKELDAYSKKLADEKQRKLAAEERKKRIESQFSAWDGSHRSLERVVKSSMHNPDSYEHVKTVYWDRKDHLVVQTTFRGTNGFGGVVTNSAKAKVSLDGVVIALLD